MYKILYSAQVGESVVTRLALKMGPERSLAGFRRIEVEPIVKQIVKDTSPAAAQDH